MSSTTLPSRRTADPYADTDVVDARAPRFLQAGVSREDLGRLRDRLLGPAG